jgi:hypothetical protein
MKNISEIPDVRASEIGLRKVGNGYVAWLVDDLGNEYRPPSWLLDLIYAERVSGRNERLVEIRRSLGIEGDGQT